MNVKTAAMGFLGALIDYSCVYDTDTGDIPWCLVQLAKIFNDSEYLDMKISLDECLLGS